MSAKDIVPESGQQDAGVLRHFHGWAGCITATIAPLSPPRNLRETGENRLDYGGSIAAQVAC
jgi:hypothetical protein